MRNDGGPAFGGAYDQVFGEDNGKGSLHKIEARVAGMSLRDYFAAAALTGLLSSPNIVPKDGVKRPLHVELTYTAYECADAMLAEREKP